MIFPRNKPLKVEVVNPPASQAQDSHGKVLFDGVSTILILVMTAVALYIAVQSRDISVASLNVAKKSMDLSASASNQVMQIGQADAIRATANAQLIAANAQLSTAVKELTATNKLLMTAKSQLAETKDEYARGIAIDSQAWINNLHALNQIFLDNHWAASKSIDTAKVTLRKAEALTTSSTGAANRFVERHPNLSKKIQLMNHHLHRIGIIVDDNEIDGYKANLNISHALFSFLWYSFHSEAWNVPDSTFTRNINEGTCPWQCVIDWENPDIPARHNR